MKLLIIDDHFIIGAGFALVLKKEYPDLDSEVISNPELGFEMFVENEYDLVVIKSYYKYDNNVIFSIFLR